MAPRKSAPFHAPTPPRARTQLRTPGRVRPAGSLATRRFSSPRAWSRRAAGLNTPTPAPTVSEVMDDAGDILVLKDTQTMREAAEAFRRSGAHAAGVESEHGDLLGTLSQADLLHALMEFLPGGKAPPTSSMPALLEQPCRMFMSPVTLSTGPSIPLAEALEDLLNHHSMLLPVVEGPYLVGLLTRNGVTSWLVRGVHGG